LPPRSSNADEVKAAYRRLAFEAHPDRGGKTEDFVRLTNARDDALRELGTP
jgi:curved DNA-binding protein CbpA